MIFIILLCEDLCEVYLIYSNDFFENVLMFLLSRCVRKVCKILCENLCGYLHRYLHINLSKKTMVRGMGDVTFNN